MANRKRKKNPLPSASFRLDFSSSFLSLSFTRDTNAVITKTWIGYINIEKMAHVYSCFSASTALSLSACNSTTQLLISIVITTSFFFLFKNSIEKWSEAFIPFSRCWHKWTKRKWQICVGCTEISSQKMRIWMYFFGGEQKVHFGTRRVSACIDLICQVERKVYNRYLDLCSVIRRKFHCRSS